MTLSPEKHQRHVADCQAALDAYAEAGENRAKAAAAVGVAPMTLFARLQAGKRMGLAAKAVRKVPEVLKPLSGGREHVFAMTKRGLPPRGKVKRYLLTSAQNNTLVNAEFWEGLLAFAGHIGAEIIVSRYTYNKSAWRSYGGVVKDAGKIAFEDMWFDAAFDDYLCDERVELAPGLSFCGEVDILPTAVNPLSGFESYTGRNSGIFPHAKIAMQSVAAAKFEPTKFNYTTGTATLRNYIQRKAGLKAEFHHAYGALLVEVDDRGRWYCRQINADKTGTFYDLDVRVHRGKVAAGHRPESITWGDIHVRQIDEDVRELAWGKGGMLDALNPRRQFFHDLFDMHGRGHHDLKDPHLMFARHVRAQESVRDELGEMADFLRFAGRKGIKSIVVDSNHHDHLARWLKETDWRKDPVNAEFYMDAQRAVLAAIRANDSSFNLLKWAAEYDGKKADVRFLAEDESYITCPDHGGGIENGLHGHHGINGARGSGRSFSRMGRKTNTGHSHTAGIFDGAYVAGTSSRFDLGYNKGPSSWSHSHIVTYPNGKRAIVTMWDGKWRA